MILQRYYRMRINKEKSKSIFFFLKLRNGEKSFNQAYMLKLKLFILCNIFLKIIFQKFILNFHYKTITTTGFQIFY